jgi:hypothetical protein
MAKTERLRRCRRWVKTWLIDLDTAEAAIVVIQGKLAGVYRPILLHFDKKADGSTTIAASANLTVFSNSPLACLAGDKIRFCVECTWAMGTYYSPTGEPTGELALSGSYGGGWSFNRVIYMEPTSTTDTTRKYSSSFLQCDIPAGETAVSYTFTITTAAGMSIVLHQATMTLDHYRLY